MHPARLFIRRLPSPCTAQFQQCSADRYQQVGPDGTAYATRVVPVLTTISPEAQKVLARVVTDAAEPKTLEQRRTVTDKWPAGAGEASKKLYPANVTPDTIAGVPVRVVIELQSDSIFTRLFFRLPTSCVRRTARLGLRSLIQSCGVLLEATRMDRTHTKLGRAERMWDERDGYCANLLRT